MPQTNTSPVKTSVCDTPLFEINALPEEMSVDFFQSFLAHCWNRIKELNNFRSYRQLSITFLSDLQMAELNHSYRGKSGATDILTFELEAPVNDPLGSMGDIYLCMNAMEDQFGLQSKLKLTFFLVVHGLLHLQGWTHNTETDYKKMIGLQHEILEGFYETESLAK